MTNEPTIGGPIKADNVFYVKRDVDDYLFSQLKLKKLCYILESRQTGKTSLLFRTRDRLSRDGIKNVRISLAGLGTATAVEDKWYNDHMDIINEEFNLGLDLGQWIKKHEHLQSLRIFDKFIQDILLGNIEQDIVIFIDEIDTLLSLRSRFSTNDYLAFIRNCYEKRNDEPAYNRLTFCLLGVASPNSLIADKNRTPFNVGTPITLSPFPTDMNNQKSHDTMKPLLDYVQLTDVLEKILHWTGGQPFLTQKLCNLWVEQHKESKSIIIKNVDEIVESMIKNWEADDNPTHFGTIRDRLLDNDVKAFDRLKLYEEILENRQIDYNNSREQIELRLSGLVLEDEGQLRLYNPIYKEIFNLNWVEQEKAKLRLYIEEFDNWNEWEKWKETNNLDYDLQERYLLYGTKCDRVQQWRIKFNEDNGKLYEKEGNFLDRSQTFWREVKDLFSDLQINEGTMESIIQSANDLTGGLHKFNRIVFNIAKNNNVVDLQQDEVQQDEVQGWLENLVLSNSSNLELFKEYDLFRQDRDQFLNRDDSFDLISLFEKIYQNEPILFDEKNPQHRKLKDMCFIILDKEHNLRILNRIYEKILDQNWIKEVMAGLRPYTKAFRDWQHSDRQESSYLLQNNDLKLALEWLGKKPTPTLEEGEIKFVMTSLVAEVWTTASPSVQSEAVSLITTFRPSLKGKNNYSDFLLQEILQWTTSQTAALKKLLEWVNESDIPVENIRKYLEFLVRSQIKNWSYQELFDFALAPHSSYPEREQRIFITFDQYCLGEIDQSQIQEPLKECGKILDKYQNLNENDFQELVFNFLKTKIARISLMTQQQPEQEKLDVLLDETVTTSKGHLKSILIFNLENGLPLYHNKRLKSDDPELYHALFADGGDAVGEAIEGFESLSKIQEALDNFGKVTAFGNLTYSIFKLAEGTMMVYFVELTTPFAICFIAPDGINLGLVVTRSQAKIKEIKNELEELGF
ncbi:MAG: AAA-like domain-containing protein [Microcystis sp. LE19-388.1G]|jgi:hypothetical protein|nr:AAA-like domain-containing protein [Microcystis sp. LE19-388.1G]